MAFDPDKYLQGGGGFDPDAYLGIPAQKDSNMVADVIGGAVRGAGSIGATILAPIDAAARAVGIENEFIGRRDRRQAMDEALRGMGVDTDSMAFNAGKIGTEIAGTLPIGGVLAKGLRLVPGVASAAPKLVSAVESGGFTLGSPAATTLLGKAGDLGLRTLGGAAVGGAAAGMVDPESAGTGAAIGGALPGALKVAGGLGKATGYVGKKLVGGMTGVGDEALSTAYKAGREGNRTFLENMRGKADMTDVLDDAKSALDNMRVAKNEAYNSGMVDIRGDKSVLGFDGIDKALKTGFNRVSFKGKTVDQKAAGYLDEVMESVNEWKGLNPGEFHTPSGMDALKQKIGATLESIPLEQKNARAIVGEIYNSVKNVITKDAPKYAEVMKDYSQASELINEIQRSLIGGKRASADASMRKLQSLMRNNVQTNYGNRLDLAKELADKGGKDVLPGVAGQAMQELLPRSLSARIGGVGLGMSAVANPALWAVAPFASPRLMGEALYGAGRAGGATKNALAELIAKGVPVEVLQALAKPNPQLQAIKTIAPAVTLGTP
jgi:hypothetical protein